MVKCLKCGFGVSGAPAFCPNCGAPMARKMTDAEISKLIFSRFGKKYDQALENAYTACISDLEDRSLHKNLFLMRRMDLLSREGEYQDVAVKRFIEKNKSDAKLKEALSHYKLGLIYETGKRLKAAEKEYDKALSALPEFASVLLRKGMISEVRSRLRGQMLPRKTYQGRALRNYSQAGEVDPQFPLAFFCQGIILKNRKKLDAALQNYLKCVALDSDCAAAHNNLGLIYVDKRDFESAEKEFNELLRIFPNHPTGLRNLELVRKKKGRGLRRFF